MPETQETAVEHSPAPPPPLFPAPAEEAPAPLAAEPEKPKAAYLIVEPLETPTPDVDPEGKPTEPGQDQIVATGALTIVMVKTTGSPRVNKWNAVKLPKDAADLSVVEVHRDPVSNGPDVAVFPNKDEQIGALPVNDGTNKTPCAVGVGSTKPKSFRKMSKTLWAVIS